MFTVDEIIQSRYLVAGIIAPGGMGEVWKCLDSTLSRFVALKTVNPHYISIQPETLLILHDEAKSAAPLLGHPNIVGVLDLGRYDRASGEIHYIVMEYVDGITVNEWIKYKNKLDAETYINLSLLISLEACNGIEFAHRQNVLHRDIKPLNIFISKFGRIKIGDFGLARFVDAMTRAYTVKSFGTPAYTAPEQWKGEEFTFSSDIYQIGCTLYHIFTGRTPFEGDTFRQMYCHLNEKPEAPENINSLISTELSDIILQCLDKDESERPVMWEVHDAICNEIHHQFTMEIDIRGKSDDIVKTVCDITNFNDESLKADAFDWKYPDYREVLSEGLELVLAGITKFSIFRPKDTVEREAAATLAK